MITFSVNKIYTATNQLKGEITINDLSEEGRSVLGQVYIDEVTGKRKSKVGNLDAFGRKVEESTNLSKMKRESAIVNSDDIEKGYKGTIEASIATNSFEDDSLINRLDAESNTESNDEVVSIFLSIVEYIEELTGENLVALSNQAKLAKECGSSDELREIQAKIINLFVNHNNLDDLPLDKIVNDISSVHRVRGYIKDDDFDYTLSGYLTFIITKQLGGFIGLEV